MSGLSGKRALVTGASGGLGRAIAQRLAADGAHVVLHAHRRLADAQAVAAGLSERGLSAEACAFDLLDRAACVAGCERMLAAGPIQVLVNNAGTHADAAFPALREDQWRGVIDVSVHGFFHVTQALLMPMIRTRWGRIVNISSVAALAGNRGQVNYAAAKAALHGATKALALEVASRGITVNAVAPGIVDAGMASGVFDTATLERLVPMKRAGRTEEIAAVVSFLASPDASYLTGQVLSVSGGLY
jgi:3-oxoacyl-[acyl-carrier protein] reductase